MAEPPWATFHSSSPDDMAQSRAAINSCLIGSSFLVKSSDLHMALDQWFSTLAPQWHSLRSWKHTGAWVPPTRRVRFNWLGVWPGHPDTYKLRIWLHGAAGLRACLRRGSVTGAKRTFVQHREHCWASPRRCTALSISLLTLTAATCPELAFSKLPSITNYFHCSNQSHTKYHFVLNTLNDQPYYSLLFLSLVLTSLSCGHHWYFGQFHRTSG